MREREALMSPAIRDRSGESLRVAIFPSHITHCSYSLSICGCYKNEEAVIALPLEFARVGMFEQLDPVMNLSDNEVQNLMDSLWQCGIRPSNGEGAVGQIGAVKSHLEDMRKIVSHYTKVNL